MFKPLLKYCKRQHNQSTRYATLKLARKMGSYYKMREENGIEKMASRELSQVQDASSSLTLPSLSPAANSRENGIREKKIGTAFNNITRP